MRTVFLLCMSVFLLNAQTLYEIWKDLEVTDKGLKASTSDVKAAKLKTDSVKSMYLPKISLVGSYTRLEDNIKIEGDAEILFIKKHFRFDLSEKDVFLANLSLLWPLYTGGKIDAAQAVFKSRLDEAKAKEEMQKDKKFLTLVKLYYGEIVAKSLVDTEEEAVLALKRLYKNATLMKKEGQIANIELLQAKSKLDLARIELKKAKSKLDVAHFALASLVSKDIKTTDNLLVFGVENNFDISNNKTLDLLDAKTKQVNSLIKIKKSNYFPTVVGYGNYMLYKDNSPLMQTLPTWFAGVMVKFDILRRSDRADEIAIAKLKKHKVELLKSEALKNLKVLAEKTYKEMMADKQEYELLESSLKLAKENLRLREISFKEGLVTALDVTEANAMVEAIKTKRLNAAYQFLQKLAFLCVLSGEREKFFEFLGEK